MKMLDHVGLAVSDYEASKGFYEAAFGPISNGEPGLRPLYHENYYGSYALDPDGNNVEAVCHVAP